MEFLLSEQKKFYDENGYLVLQNIVSCTDQLVLKSRIKQIIDNIPKNEINGVFLSGEKQLVMNKNDYFISSGDKIRIFLEENTNGSDLKINKIGHALHLLDPIYSEFTHSNTFKKIAHDIGVNTPLVAQSMYIFKSPGAGGKVYPHQDGTFLGMETGRCHAYWIPMEDTTKENGCLWIIPGSHKGKLVYKFKLNKKTKTTYFEPPLCDKQTNDIWKESEYVPLEVPKGSLILLHGLVVHKSDENRSQLPRDAYTFHIIDANDKWSEDNWLQYENGHGFVNL